jgi:hypothetical protein
MITIYSSVCEWLELLKYGVASGNRYSNGKNRWQAYIPGIGLTKLFWNHKLVWRIGNQTQFFIAPKVQKTCRKCNHITHPVR